MGKLVIDGKSETANGVFGLTEERMEELQNGLIKVSNHISDKVIRPETMAELFEAVSDIPETMEETAFVFYKVGVVENHLKMLVSLSQ